MGTTEVGHEDVIDEHYERMADNYDSHLSYSGDFVHTLSRSMVEKLRLSEEDRFVDLGGGTGLYTAAILELVALRHPPLLVDPVAAMLDQASEDLGARKLAQGAVAWATDAAAQGETYDKVLMKESIHHIEARAKLLGHLHDCLAPGGALLLVHIPPQIEYPLFTAALERSLEWHADPDELERLVKEAGFDVERETFEYRHRIPREQYVQMVSDQYMSVLSTFSEAEIEAGMAEIEERYGDTDVLEYTDRFECITGRKAA